MLRDDRIENSLDARFALLARSLLSGVHQHDLSAPFEVLLQSRQFGDRRQAWATPRGPKVDDDRFRPRCSQAPLAAALLSNRKIRRRIARLQSFNFSIFLSGLAGINKRSESVDLLSRCNVERERSVGGRILGASRLLPDVPEQFASFFNHWSAAQRGARPINKVRLRIESDAQFLASVVRHQNQNL